MAAVLRRARLAGAVVLACLMLLVGPVRAQEQYQGPLFSQQELDQMLAPIALYPDSLLSQILMAATYPLEVVEAQRWSVANPTLSGNAALQAVEETNWDPSVKSLVAFPRILQTMGSKLDWTQRLGDAFLGQQQQVMDTVQTLRRKAYAAGNLVSNAQDQVLLQGDTIRIEPVNPQMAYVPYYDPGLVYGPWWWPAYPPVYWEPWPGYNYIAGYGRGFLWGAGLLVGADFLFGAFDWEHHHVNVNYARFHDRHFHRSEGGPGPWQHNPYHREGIPYRQPELRGTFANPQAAPQARRAYRGFAQPVPSPTPAPVPSPAPAPGMERGHPVPFVTPPPREAPRPHAFENIGQGQAVRGFSERGQRSVRPVPPPTPPSASRSRPCAGPNGCAPPEPPRAAPGTVLRQGH